MTMLNTERAYHIDQLGSPCARMRHKANSP